MEMALWIPEILSGKNLMMKDGERLRGELQRALARRVVLRKNLVLQTRMVQIPELSKLSKRS